MHKTKRLDRTIFMLVTVLFSAIMILLLLINIYLFRRDRMAVEEREQSALEAYVQETGDSIRQIKNALYDIYSMDSNFLYLQKEHLELPEYQAAYELSLILRNYCQVDQSFSAYSLVYHNLEKSFFNLDYSKFPYTDIRPLNEALKKYTLSGDVSQTFCICVKEHLYLSVQYQKGNAALFGVHALYRIEEELKERGGRAAHVIVYDGQSFLSGEELAKRLKLDSRLSDYKTQTALSIGGYRIYGKLIPGTTIWIFTAYDSALRDYINVLTIITFFITILALCISIYLSIFVHQQMIAPLNKIVRMMEKIRSGETRSIEKEYFRYQEFDEIRNTMAGMIESLEQQKILTYEENAKKQQIQLQYLGLQLKPHFYLNSLKTLDALIFENEPKKAHDLVLDLSAYLRYLIHVEREVVPLSEELEFTKNYVNMQKYISSRKLEYEQTCDEEALSWKVPMLCVQTFVENSVKYAWKNTLNQPLKITVSIEVLETENSRILDLIVRDNGIGYSEAFLKEFYQPSVDTIERISVGTEGVGIYNIIRRLLLLYEDQVESSLFNDDGAVFELILKEKQDSKVTGSVAEDPEEKADPNCEATG